jgi:hypothetical protein
MKSFFKICIALFVLTISSKVHAQSGTLIFKEGNNGSQNTVATITDAPNQFYDLKNEDPYDIGANDEARSLVLNNVRVGAIISVYNAPSGDASDCYAVITVKTLLPTIVIDTFQTPRDDANVRVQWFPHGSHNLDGYVSAIRVN